MVLGGLGATALAVALGSASAVQPSLTARVVIGGAAAAVFVRYPFALLLTWATAAMFGDLRVEALGGQSIFGALTYVSLPCFALVAVPRMPRLIREQPWVGLWLAFVALVFINLPRSPQPLGEAIREFVGYPATLCVLTLAATELKNARRAALLTWAVLIPSTVIALIAVYQYFAGVGGLESQGVYRVFSVFEWTNTLAFFLIVPLGWTAALIRITRDQRVRLVVMGLFMVLAAAEFFTFGRGGWLGAVIAVCAPLLITLRPVRLVPARGLALLGALGIVAVTLAFLPGVDLSERVGDVANVQGRAMIWDYVLGRAMDQPFIGHGFGGAADLTAQAIDELTSQGVHNSYVMIFFDYGAVGLLLFCATWMALLAQLALTLFRVSRTGAAVLLATIFTTLGVLVYSGAGLELVDFAPSMYLWLIAGWASAGLVGARLASNRPQLAGELQPEHIHARERSARDRQLQQLRPSQQRT